LLVKKIVEKEHEGTEMTTKIIWTAPLGQSLEFWVYSSLSALENLAGIYAFCRRELDGSYTVLYIGQSQDLLDRLRRHERWRQAVDRGASVVAVAIVLDEKARDYFEQSMIREFDPPLNDHYRPRFPYRPASWDLPLVPSIPFPFRPGSYKLPWE